MKNKRIRMAMAQAGIRQTTLAEILGKSDKDISIILNQYELAVREQNEIVKRIREWAALNMKGA